MARQTFQTDAKADFNNIDVTDSLPHTLTHKTFGYFGQFFVIYGLIWMFFTVLLPRI